MREGKGKRSSLSSVAVERADALELPGTNSSGSRRLFLAIPIFQMQPFITPLAKYNKKRMGSCVESQSVTMCPRMTCEALLREENSPYLCVKYCSYVSRNYQLYFRFLFFVI